MCVYAEVWGGGNTDIGRWSAMGGSADVGRCTEMHRGAQRCMWGRLMWCRLPPPPCVGVQGEVSVGGAGSGAELLCVVGIVCRE